MRRARAAALALWASAAAAQELPGEADVSVRVPGLGWVTLEDVPLSVGDDPFATPLHAVAAATDDPELVRLMIAAGADPAARAADGRTPLHVAAAENPDPVVAAALAAGGAPLDASDAAGRTALHLAADPRVAALLALSGADACRTDAAGRPALSAGMLAAIRAEAAQAYPAARAAFLRCLD